MRLVSVFLNFLNSVQKLNFSFNLLLVETFSPGMESLLLSEIILLLLIFMIWFISFYTFIYRYKLVLCFNTRDVPFYKSQVLNKTNDNLDNNSLVPLTSFVETKSTCDCSVTGEPSYMNVEGSNRSSFMCSLSVKLNEKIENPGNFEFTFRILPKFFNLLKLNS